MGIAIRLKNDSEYQSIQFNIQNPRLNEYYITAIVKKHKDQGSDRVKKIYYNNVIEISSSEKPISRTIYTKVTKVLDRRDTSLIVIIKKNGKVLVNTSKPT